MSRALDTVISQAVMPSQLIGPSRNHRRLSDDTLISTRTNCMKKRETSNDIKTGPEARPVFLLSLLHKGTSYFDLTRKRLNPFGRIFGDCSKWNERPISDGSQSSASRLTIAHFALPSRPRPLRYETRTMRSNI